MGRQASSGDIRKQVWSASLMHQISQIHHDGRYSVTLADLEPLRQYKPPAGAPLGEYVERNRLYSLLQGSHI